MGVKIIVGNALDVLPTLEPNSVHCSVSSPPYFGLRKYAGVQQSEWPEIEYSPMSGLPPIRLLGCDSECEHEWGKQLRQVGKVSHGLGGSTLTGGKDSWGDRKGGHSGSYCQKCGGWRGALGNEPTIEMYIGHLVAIYREVYRVLREDGVAWCVMGDSFAGSWGNYGHRPELDKTPSHQREKNAEYWSRGGWDKNRERPPASYKSIGLKQGNPMMVPHRLALALQADSWIVRNDVVWHKVAPMPESVSGWRWQRHRIKVKKSDRATSPYHEAHGNHPQGAGVAARAQREAYYEKGEGAPRWIDCPGCPKCEKTDGYVLKRGSWRHTRAHEFVIHMVKNMQYFADQEKVRERNVDPARIDYTPGKGRQTSIEFRKATGDLHRGFKNCQGATGRNPRSVLTPKPEPFPGSHFAVYPTSLIEPLIKATCPDKCCPECGKGWSPIVKKRKADITNPRPFSKLGNEDDRNDVGRIYEETTSNVIGYRQTCECGCEESIPGIVLDPFGGAGTTGLVASRLGLNGILLEISEEYARMAQKRIIDDAPLFNRVSLEFLSEQI